VSTISSGKFSLTAITEDGRESVKVSSASGEDVPAATKETSASPSLRSEDVTEKQEVVEESGEEQPANKTEDADVPSTQNQDADQVENQTVAIAQEDETTDAADANADVTIPVELEGSASVEPREDDEAAQPDDDKPGDVQVSEVVISEEEKEEVAVETPGNASAGKLLTISRVEKKTGFLKKKTIHLGFFLFFKKKTFFWVF